MALPVVNTIKTTIRTQSGKDVTVSAFTGYDEKMLLTAKASNDQKRIASAMWDLIDRCTAENVDSLTVAEAEFIFLHAYALSVSPDINTTFICEGCEEHINVSFPISDITVPTTKPETKKLEVGKTEDGKTVTVVFNPITFKSVVNSVDAGDDMETMILFNNLEGIYVGDEETSSDVSFEEFKEWFLGLHKVYAEAIRYIVDQDTLTYKRDFVCQKCKHNNEVELKGYKDFF